MPAIPIPFIVALFLVLLFLKISREDEGHLSNHPFMLVIALSAVQSILVGIFWGYEVTTVRLLMPIMAASLPAVLYLGFKTLTSEKRQNPIKFYGPHFVPVVLLVTEVLFWQIAIDITLIAIYLLYAFLLLHLASKGPNALKRARFESVKTAHRALCFAGGFLIFSASIDVAVLLDIELSQGSNTPVIIALANVFGLLVLSLAANMAKPSEPGLEQSKKTGTSPPLTEEELGEDSAVIARVDTLMRIEKFHHDPDLNLNRLGRRLSLPARRISIAINRCHGQNVSQYINGYRIEEACKLLSETDLQITQIIYESGFQTKSNFNREFRRITGQSPKDWRLNN